MPAEEETKAATSAICFGLSWPLKEGITPLPFVTRSTTRSADGFASSSSGPPCRSLPQPSTRGSSRNRPSRRPSFPPPRHPRCRRRGRRRRCGLRRRRARCRRRRLGRGLTWLLWLLGEPDDRPEHRGREEDRDPDERPEPTAREMRSHRRKHERRHERERDEDGCGDSEPDLMPSREGEHARILDSRKEAALLSCETPVNPTAAAATTSSGLRTISRNSMTAPAARNEPASLAARSIRPAPSDLPATACWVVSVSATRDRLASRVSPCSRRGARQVAACLLELQLQP